MAVQTLVERVLYQQRVDLGHGAAMPPRGPLCLDRELAGLQAQILELADRGHRERFVRDIGQRWTTPQAKSAPEDVSGAVAVAAFERLPAVADVGAEDIEIELTPSEAQPVALRDRF